MQEIITKKLSEEDKLHLQRPVEADEIQKAMFSMKRGTAPGPDGFTVDFFIHNWSIVGKDMVKAISYCFENDYMYKPLNSTIITLVPKVPTPKTMKEFRPIACCNIVYKC